MKITRDNYESFFLDYLEGNLEEQYIDQFLDFLEQHPDLKEELHLFENIHLPEEPIAFTGKKHLYQPALEDTFELKAIALMEGDLKDKERQSFKAHLAQNPELEKEAALFEKTRLAADKSIIYPEKEKLYKTSGTVVLMNWLARAAAVVILLWGIHSMLESERESTAPISPKEVATVKTPLGNEKAEAEKAEAEAKEAEAKKAEANKAEKAERAVETDKQGPGKENPISPEKIQQASSTIVNEPAVKEETIMRESVEVKEIAPLVARLENEPAEGQLAVSRAINRPKVNEPRTVLTVDEYLASRAKKATNEGLLSAHRLIRAGLNVASELSGDRIEYTVKKGKVSSLGFESKLLAFSIPLEKK